MATEPLTGFRAILADESRRVFELSVAGEQWATRHATAWDVPGPRSHESAIVHLVRGLADYADACNGSPGHDWLTALESTRALLRGETGRLHAATVDAMLVRMATAAGFGRADL